MQAAHVGRELNLKRFSDGPVFCFTADCDWAPEWVLRDFVALFDHYEIPLTPFITNKSDVIEKRYQAPELRPRVGLHPNFLPGSTHGTSVEEVVEHVCGLWPDAVCFRSHSFSDSSPMMLQFARRGFVYDSNLALFFPQNAQPVQHCTGIVRFPVYWEDDVHRDNGCEFDFSRFRHFFEAPGLKVINCHPVLIALNLATLADYNAVKPKLSAQFRKGRIDPADRIEPVRGNGPRTFLIELLDFIKSKRLRSTYLDDAYLEVTDHRRLGTSAGTERLSAPDASNSNVGAAVSTYQSSNSDARASIVRAAYDSRDGKQVYVTSPDFHLRELEIRFIAEHFEAGNTLDIGCGNGYTLLSLAKQFEASFTGLDFSPEMIAGAAELTKRLQPELKAMPCFRQADIRRLDYPADSFDTIITERCLLNLPTRKEQFDTIREIHRVLKPGGVYLMVEGTEDGLERLNALRMQLGLEAIPSVSEGNFSSLKFREAELTAFLDDYFDIEATRYFGTYYLISRVVQPLLVQPEKPRFDAKINAIGRQIAEIIPDFEKLGHVVGYKLRAKNKPARRRG
jgi:ubiquinone/menaquinone biosynthesis C-methylase UbiE